MLCLFVLCGTLPCAAQESEGPDYGTLTGQTRLYYFTQRNKTTGDDYDDVRESLAVGGYLKYETPWLADHFGAGIAGYASMPLFDELNKRDEGGTGLLTPKNNSIFALGEAYLKGRYGESEVRLWRQRIETPFINGNDSRMLPQAFEAYGVKSGDIENLDLSLYWIDKEKARDTEVFVSMTEMAGLQGTEGGVFMAGADWKPVKQMPTRFWNYFAPDLDNTFFTQLSYVFGDPQDVEFSLMFQGVDQRSVGSERAGEYNTGEAGLLGKVKFNGVFLELGGTVVDNSRAIRNSWGTYAFFNNLMSYAFNRAGEKALHLGAGYDFAGVGWDGFTANVKAGFGDTPDSGRSASFDRDEYDLNLEYKFDGDLKGLSLLNRWSLQDADEDLGGRDGFQVRLRLQYDFQLM